MKKENKKLKSDHNNILSANNTELRKFQVEIDKTKSDNFQIRNDIKKEYKNIEQILQSKLISKEA